MNKNFLLVMILVAAFTNVANADLKVKATVGGFTVSSTSPHGYSDMASREADVFEVEGTGLNSVQVPGLAHSFATKGTADRNRQLESTLGKMFGRPAPVVTHHHHHTTHHHTTVVSPPAIVTPPLPWGVYVNRWIVPGTRFYDSLGRRWYWDPALGIWVYP